MTQSQTIAQRREQLPSVFFAFPFWCFIRELLFTFSLSSTTCDSAWVSRGFSVIKHV